MNHIEKIQSWCRDILYLKENGMQNIAKNKLSFVQGYICCLENSPKEISYPDLQIAQDLMFDTSKKIA